MDANKLERLRRSGYVVRATCSLCVHGSFPNDDWGTCGAIVYDHAKHSEGRRNLPIHRSGRCEGGFELSEEEAAKLGAFRELLED